MLICICICKVQIISNLHLSGLQQVLVNCHYLVCTTEHCSIKEDDAGKAVHKQGETSYQMQYLLTSLANCIRSICGPLVNIL